MLRRCAPALALFFLLTAAGRSQLIDDFESYVDTPDLQTVWVAAELDEATPVYGPGSKSLFRSGETSYGSGWSTWADYAPPLDLSAQRLGVWVRRSPASVSPTRLLIGIRDGMDRACSGALELEDSEWHDLTIDPAGSGCAATSIDPADIVRVTFNVTNRDPESVAEIAAGNFDDLTIFLHRGGFESGDFTGWIVEPEVP